MKKIGIIGGMGPESTILFYMDIVRIFQEEFNAKYDSDYPEMYIYNLPIPDVVENNRKSDTVKAMLCNAAKKLERTGADFLTIPCNTVQIYYDDIRKSVSVPVINIIEEVMKRVKYSGFTKSGILATETLFESGLYQKFAKGYGIEIVMPGKNEKRDITNIIMRILNGKKLPSDVNRINKIIENLKSKGAECIILGCTDLPALIEKYGNSKIFDTIRILAESTVNIAVEKGN